MARRFWWAWFLGAVVAGCAQPIPVEDPNGPTPPVVHPPDPTHPPEPVSVGSITEAAYAAAPESGPEASLVASLGEPFRKTITGGYTIYVYAFVNSDSVAWFFVKDGAVERKWRQ